MAAEIDMSNGRANVMVTGEAAWHGLGVRVDEAPSSAAAIGLAGLDWRVESWPLRAYDAELDKSIQVPGKVALIRDDTKAVLGVHGTAYRALQNVDAFRFLDSLVDTGEVRYETAGSLKGGRVVWMLARMPGEVVVGDGDAQRPYMLLSNSHDGTSTIRVLPTSIRVVCNNTLQYAYRRGVGEGVKIPHLGDLDAKIERTRAALGLIRAGFDSYGEQVRAMAGRSMVRAEGRAFFADLMPLTADATNRQTKSVERKRERLMELWTDEPANTMDGVRGTAWGALNAVTQYVDHEARATGEGDGELENRLRSAWFGSGQKLKDRALRQAMALAN